MHVSMIRWCFFMTDRPRDKWILEVGRKYKSHKSTTWSKSSLSVMSSLTSRGAAVVMSVNSGSEQALMEASSMFVFSGFSSSGPSSNRFCAGPDVNINDIDSLFWYQMTSNIEGQLKGEQKIATCLLQWAYWECLQLWVLAPDVSTFAPKQIWDHIFNHNFPSFIVYSKM